MERKAEVRLKKWIQSNSRKPLIIRGARQVGKSTLVRQFANENNLILHEINLERHTTLIDVFKTFDYWVSERYLKIVYLITKFLEGQK